MRLNLNVSKVFRDSAKFPGWSPDLNKNDKKKGIKLQKSKLKAGQEHRKLKNEIKSIIPTNPTYVSGSLKIKVFVATVFELNIILLFQATINRDRTFLCHARFVCSVDEAETS